MANNNFYQQEQNRPACAACEYRRRKCNPDCLLAPYFPQHNLQQFINAHRLFKVSYMIKTLKSLSPDDHHKAMHDIIFIANARANDPVGGCKRIIDSLSYQIAYFRNEFHHINAQIHAIRNSFPRNIHLQYVPPPSFIEHPGSFNHYYRRNGKKEAREIWEVRNRK
ncbi:LOB domain-containing protein 22-like [Amaranthus tricolor]|uniref:LOB domain-containing protein 22-like n=1 Tax=Amaranthus tricolor TaxID=29722 RepID=UPI00258B7731|nr:LOB domain-containing protein 22-like [Amaranthus tricolor]